MLSFYLQTQKKTYANIFFCETRSRYRKKHGKQTVKDIRIKFFLNTQLLTYRLKMGGGDSKRIQSLEKQQEQLMRQNAEMAQRLAREQENSQKQHQAHVEEMAKLMLVLVAAAAAAEETAKPETKTLEIEGVTYNITEKIGEGGFGQIYKGEDRKNHREVAIKAMKNSPLIQREIEGEIRFLRLMKKLTLNPHPVIEFYGCKATPDAIFIALELASCNLLEFWFQGMQKRSAEERFTFGTIIIMYTLRALTFLERLNIIHGDIKPQNLVLIQRDKYLAIKLIDFGTVEKMHTLRALATVDATKAYTQFFASPEFLRRDSKNMVARRLHKKSDAWAAGVMFYLLFLAKLPWEDEHQYHNFINDPHAKDVVIPGDGGYKLIIELLLKKDPDERASAKETLLQMKAHPVLGAIVATLEEALYPCDDVCKIKVPDTLREELASFATPQKRAGGSGDEGTSASAATTDAPSIMPPKNRISCRYGRNCYRKNPDHKAEFAHPGDYDFSETKAHAKIKCRYGTQCFRKGDASHMAKYSH